MDSTFYIPLTDGRISVNKRDRKSLLETIRERFKCGEGFAVATLNLDHIVKLRRHSAFRSAYRAHDLVVADGNPVVWLSRLAGRPVSLVAGSDLVEPLCQLAAEEAMPVALVGATSETLASAAAELTRRCPSLQLVARIAPGKNFDAASEEADGIIDALERSGSRLVLLALGAPRQELFAARLRAALPSLSVVSVGAGLDFLAGTQRRAPLWMQQIALEWLWRMLSSPRRLVGRYASCALLLPRMAIIVLAGRRA